MVSNLLVVLCGESDSPNRS